MTSIEKKCRKLWGAGVCLRDGHCQLSGSPVAEAHHLFGRDCWLLCYDMDFGILVSPHHHRMLHGTGGFQYGTPIEQKETTLKRLVDRLLQIDERRAAKIIKQWERPKPEVSSPCWDNVLQWVTEQHKKIEDEEKFDEDIEPSFGRTTP